MRQTSKESIVTLPCALAASLEGRGPLAPGYDIFRGLEDNEVIWVGCAESLDDAKSKIVALGSVHPGRYFVRCATTGKIIADIDRTSTDEARA